MNATFEGWAILELMGHRKLAGYVQEATVAGAAMLRIDVPQGDKTVTQFYAPHSLYAITPTTEATVRAFGGNRVEPVTPWEMKTLPAHATAGSMPGDDDDGSSGSEFDPDDDMGGFNR